MALDVVVFNTMLPTLKFNTARTKPRYQDEIKNLNLTAKPGSASLILFFVGTSTKK